MAQWAKMFNNLLERGLEEELEKTKRYVQKDLEDQIEEEYKALGKTYQRTEKREKMDISAKEIVNLLQSGYTRYAKDDKGYGSIQAKYGLTNVQVVELFSNDVIKHKKTVMPKSAINLINDIEEEQAPQGGRDVITENIPSASTALNELVTSLSESIAEVVSLVKDEEIPKVETETPQTESVSNPETGEITTYSLFA